MVNSILRCSNCGKKVSECHCEVVQEIPSTYEGTITSGTISEATLEHDKVNSPSWYTKGGIETIDYIAAKELNFNRGNVIKYTTRAGHKPGDYDKELEDLKKARVYLTDEINRLEKRLTKS